MKYALVADDSTTMRRLVGGILKERAGFEIIEAEDGKEAIEKLHGNTTVDFISTDFNMPNVDGAGLIRSLRAIPKYKQTPVLVITTNDQARDQVKLAGANGWIKKPFSPDALLNAVNRLCS